MPGPCVESNCCGRARFCDVLLRLYRAPTQKDPGKVENLKRHLLCFKKDTGDLLWSREIDATLPEDAFSGMGITEHGYASSTPVSDGERVDVWKERHLCL